VLQGIVHLTILPKETKDKEIIVDLDETDLEFFNSSWKLMFAYLPSFKLLFLMNSANNGYSYEEYCYVFYK